MMTGANGDALLIERQTKIERRNGWEFHDE